MGKYTLRYKPENYHEDQFVFRYRTNGKDIELMRTICKTLDDIFPNLAFYPFQYEKWFGISIYLPRRVVRMEPGILIDVGAEITQLLNTQSLKYEP